MRERERKMKVEDRKDKVQERMNNVEIVAIPTIISSFEFCSSLPKITRIP